MSTDPIVRYKNILLEAHMELGGTVSKREANYMDRSIYQEQCRHCDNFIIPNKCKIVEGLISPGGWCKYYEAEILDEKWGTETKVSPQEKGKYAGKSKAELLKSYNALKKTGPHHRGSPEFGRMRELAFAIRAKGGWGKVD